MAGRAMTVSGGASAGSTSAVARNGLAKDGAAQDHSTKARILREAAVLFADNGYHAVGITQLVRTTELSRGTLYHHVPNKEALLFEISKGQIDAMNQAAADLAARDLPAEEKLRLLARSLLDNISHHRAEWAVFFREFTALTGERRAEIMSSRADYEAYWEAVIEQGRREGSFAVRGDLTVKALLGLFNYTYLWLDPEGGLTPEEIADGLTGLVLDGLRP